MFVYVLGKSSLISAIFRLYDNLHKGQIYIDDVDIAELTLNKLRSNIAVIPQVIIQIITILNQVERVT